MDILSYLMNKYNRNQPNETPPNQLLGMNIFFIFESFAVLKNSKIFKFCKTSSIKATGL